VRCFSLSLYLTSVGQASDLRDHVRKLRGHTMFSPEWVKMVESLQYVAGAVQPSPNPRIRGDLLTVLPSLPLIGIAAMEERLPQRSGKHEVQTLWEGEELAIRYLMEEGKSAETDAVAASVVTVRTTPHAPKSSPFSTPLFTSQVS